MLSWLPPLLLAPLATAYGPHCTDVTVSDCFTEAFLISSTAYTPAECQAGCARTPECVIWRHFQPSHCSIQIADYRSACGRTSGPTGKPGIWGGSEAGATSQGLLRRFNTTWFQHYSDSTLLNSKKKFQTRSCRHKALSCRPLGFTIEKDLQAKPVNLPRCAAPLEESV